MKKQFFIALALLLTGVSSWAQALNIGGHRAPLDVLNHIWLCAIPQSCFGNDYEATVTYGDSIIEFTIDSVAVASGETFVFAGVEGGKNYLVTALKDDSTTITGNITFTWLPVVELNGEFGNEYQLGTVLVNEPDSVATEPLLAKLKWRGNATNTAGKHKRNYRIKFLNPEDSTTKENHRFFGLRNDNNWILDAGQVDFLRVRNRVSHDLWLDMSRKPWYADSVANVRNGSRGQMVEILLNGEYRGIYNMCEPLDRKQLKLERYEETEDGQYVVHGQMWDSYQWTRTVTMSNPKRRTPGATTWDGFELKYPDKDDIGFAKWTDLENAVWYTYYAGADIEALGDSMIYHYDFPVMQDYYIFIIAIQALDNESKNIYYSCPDTQIDHRLTMTPWDLDICLGQNYSPSVNIPDMIRPDRMPTWISHIPMATMMDLDWYYNEVLERYRELRQTYLDTDSLINRYRTAVDELENCGAAAREEGRWSKDSDLAGKTLDLSAEMDYVENWLREHMAFLDEYVFIERIPPLPPEPIRGDVNGDGEVNIADVNCLVSVIQGAEDIYEGRADVNADGEVNIADVNAVIDIILNSVM